MALGLAICVATSRPWLDTFKVSAGRVLLIDNELHPETIVSRLRKVADGMMIPFDDIADVIEVLSLRGRLQHWGDLLLTLEEAVSTYQLVITDAWYRMLASGISENDNAEIAGVYNQIDQLADQLNCGIVMVHHTSK